MGFYISGHPLDKFERVLNKIASGAITAIKEKAQSGEVKIGGVVSALKLRNTKKGDRYGSFNLEDKTGFIEVITWPDVYKKCAALLGADDPIFVKGRLEVGEERMQVIANEVLSLTEAAKKSEKRSTASATAMAPAKKCTSMFGKLKYRRMSWCVYATPCLITPGRLRYFCIC